MDILDRLKCYAISIAMVVCTVLALPVLLLITFIIAALKAYKTITRR